MIHINCIRHKYIISNILNNERGAAFSPVHVRCGETSITFHHFQFFRLHTDTEKRAFPLIGNETSRSIIRNAHSRQYFSRQQMAMRWVAPRLTVGSYTAEKTKNTCGPSERSEFKKSCRTVKSWVESALKLIDILQDCKHKSCSCEWFTHP